MWFRPDYSGASASAFYRIPLAGVAVLFILLLTFIYYIQIISVCLPGNEKSRNNSKERTRSARPYTFRNDIAAK
jgi:amino acid permease